MAPSRNGVQGRFLALLASLFLLAAVTTAAAIPAPAADQSPALDTRSLFNIALPILPCFKPTVRKEWSKLTSKEKKAYTAAVMCLANKPSIAKSIPAAVHRYDDFTGVHNMQTPDIHFVGHFLPWHRYYLWAYEKALKEECGYKGTQPYWDWTKDAETMPGKSMSQFDIFSGVDGFGGNGPWVETTPEQNWMGINDRTGGGCVTDGPFVNMTLNVGPGADYSTRNPHCLIRDFAPEKFKDNVGQDTINEVIQHKKYEDFAWRLEGLPGWSMKNFHGGGHFGVGGLLGSMGDSNNSPNDPVFYLHHANIDRIWTQWQEKNLIPRILDMGGPIKAFDYSNQRAGNVTLAFKIGLNELAPEIPIAAVMYTRGPMLCYKYE
ncbi:Di-copper centre-containing protein [Ascobolus immersus RN42]|uniref:Di-copper centre-containing protein n=1 Tax=Ascobolus immersus RN42 TaxID=1160509 RepID=A0A3N4HYL5_ASCIM|nr:Di-copper centre-containing protein [Ascobolus immersus RN42]